MFSAKLTFVLAAMAVALTACGATSGEPAATPSKSTNTSGPTATQAMVCGDEIKGDVKQILRLPGEPKASSTYAGTLFTCDYALPVGRMRLSVRHSASDAAALDYLTSRRAAVGANQVQYGLSDHAYGSGTGIVLVLEDNETLEVDTTGLPTVFGDQQQKRVDLAYEVASDVLGCWTGHDGS